MKAWLKWGIITTVIIMFLYILSFYISLNDRGEEIKQAEDLPEEIKNAFGQVIYQTGGQEYLYNFIDDSKKVLINLTTILPERGCRGYFYTTLSPNGKYIVLCEDTSDIPFRDYQKTDKFNFYIKELETGETIYQNTVSSFMYEKEFWSPDGEKIFWQDGEDYTNIYNIPKKELVRIHNVRGLSWDSNSKFITFQMTTYELNYSIVNNGGFGIGYIDGSIKNPIELPSIATSTYLRETPNVVKFGIGSEHRFSHDEKKIVFEGSAPYGGIGSVSQSEVRLLNLETEEVTVISPWPIMDTFNLIWSEDDRYILAPYLGGRQIPGGVTFSGSTFIYDVIENKTYILDEPQSKTLLYHGNPNPFK